MSKLIKALKVIKNECDRHKFCNSCPLRCVNKYGETDCRVILWSVDSREPWEWPIGEVEDLEHE